MRVVVEAEAERHAPDLYSYDALAEGVDGLEGVSDLERYRADGFLLIRRAFGASAIEAARESLRELATSASPKCSSISFEASARELLEGEGRPREIWELPPEVRLGRVRKLLGFVDHAPPLRALALDVRLTRLLAQVLGKAPLLLQDMALIKPPGGREKPWHQDRAYFNVSPDTPLVGVWIAIDAATADNGCLRFVAGGHRGGARAHFARRDWQMCDPDVERTSRIAAPMSPGDCVLIDPLIPHGSPRNDTPNPRWAVQLHYGPIDVRGVPDEERLALFGGEGRGASC